jgi:transcription initiation factor IIE alpha subunit
MTRENRVVLSLDEIVGLRWQCSKCGSAISYRIDQTIRLTQACPACNEPFVEASALHAFQQLQGFADAMKAAIRATTAKQLGATLTVEVIDPPVR